MPILVKIAISVADILADPIIGTALDQRARREALLFACQARHVPTVTYWQKKSSMRVCVCV